MLADTINGLGSEDCFYLTHSCPIMVLVDVKFLGFGKGRESFLPKPGTLLYPTLLTVDRGT